MMFNSKQLLPVILLLTTACAETPVAQIVEGPGTQLQSRQAQTREYATVDKQMALRSVVATLQDLGFTIDQADVDLGTVTATRLHQYTMRMTVTVVEKRDKTVAVRANARIGEQSVKDPATYQDFFVVLDKAVFLTTNRVN